MLKNIEKIEILEEKVLFFKELLVSYEFFQPYKWKFSKQQKRIMGALLSRTVCEHNFLINRVYFDKDEPEDSYKIVQVQLARMRVKLITDDIKIKNIYDIGYSLDPAPGVIIERFLS